MKEHNIYKDVVVIALWVVVFAFFARQVQCYLREQKDYLLMVWNDRDLTEDTAEEFQKMPGIVQFVPTDTVTVEISLEEYTMEAKLGGYDLKEDFFQWEMAEETFLTGNTLALFFGKDSFLNFTNQNGDSPQESQIKQWINHYQEISLTIMDDTGRKRNGVICGILKEPGQEICMDRIQLQEAFAKSVHTRGGSMRIHGYQNAQKAKTLLADAGFLVESELP